MGSTGSQPLRRTRAAARRRYSSAYGGPARYTRRTRSSDSGGVATAPTVRGDGTAVPLDGVRRARPPWLGALRRAGDVREPRGIARRDDERRARLRVPGHRTAGPLRGDDRVPAAGSLPRVEVAQALPDAVPERPALLRGAGREDPRRRRRGARASGRRGAGDAQAEGAWRHNDHR